MPERRLDLICIGRVSVDLYGEQIGSPLEDVQSFAKYVGGCPTNIAVGTARLGLKSALITRVGDEHMGRYVRHILADEGVDVSHVKTDPERLTALVLLGIRDESTFPLIFFRERCADMALTEEDIDPAFISSARAIVVTGTHFSTPSVDAASRAAIRAARAAGVKVIFDIDYRPVLWGLTGHGSGDNFFVASDRVSAHLRSIVAECDLVVGTREEIHIAGGATDDIAALRTLRGETRAVLVMKRGADGCVVFAEDIPARIEDGLVAAGRRVKVLNAIGAGDGFMSGFLRGWLREESLATCAAYGNACGAIVVSRHGCAPAMPSWVELDDYLTRADTIPGLDSDARLNRLHRVCLRRGEWPQVLALAFDHRSQFEKLAAGNNGESAMRISRCKRLIAEGARQGAAEARVDSPGMIVDDRYGAPILAEMTGNGWWLARPIEAPGAIPVAFTCGADVGLCLRRWPAGQVVKCLVFYHPDDEGPLRQKQDERMRLLYDACVATEHELLIEILPPKDRPFEPKTLAMAIEGIYEAGVYPDWWKLPPQEAGGWRQVGAAISERDPHCRGILLLGLGSSDEVLARSFAAAAAEPLCKGFAIGRSIFAKPAESWFAGHMADTALVDAVADNYARLVDMWRRAGH